MKRVEHHLRHTLPWVLLLLLLPMLAGDGHRLVPALVWGGLSAAIFIGNDIYFNRRLRG